MRILAVLMLVSSTAYAADKLDEAAARTLVDRWLKAQNTQDFAGYQALYAKKFEGIKRAGPRTRTFDRARWLADRQKMFAKPMKVAADEVTVEALAGMSRVRFVQSFTLGRFHDEGPKELVLVLEEGRPVIAREEMVASKVAPPIDPEALVVVPGGVLLPVRADNAWGKGAARLLPRKGDYAATREVDPSKVPAEARAWVGRAVDMVEGCTATIQGLALLVRADPMQEQKDIWEGRDPGPDPAGTARRAPPATIAAALWRMAPVELIGVLDRPCPKAVWGTTTATKPVRAAVTPLPATQPEGRAAVAAMERHPAYRKVQQDYVLEALDPKAKGRWVEQTKLWKVGGAQPLLVLSASRMDSCAEFSGGLTFVFAVGADGKLTLVNDPAAQVPWVLDEAADLDGDGTPELLGHELGIGVATTLILRQRGGRYEITGQSSETLLGCYC